MGTLYIDRKGLHVKLDGNALAFYTGGAREGMVPIAPLKRVVVVGNITVDSSVLSRLADEGVALVFLSGRRNRFCGMLHGRIHNNAALRRKQYEKSLSPFCLDVSRELVSEKVAAQADFLRDALESRPDLGVHIKPVIDILERTVGRMACNGIQHETILGLEGGASAAYFSVFIRLFPDSLNFRKRVRRPPEDPVNAMLSLCYTLLHYEIVRETEVIGLDPCIGFHHTFEYGRESLACDLVEPHRPAVDRFVWDLFRERTFTDRDFAYDDERPGCYLKKNSRGRFFPIYEEWAKSRRPLYCERVRSLARRIMDGQDPLPE